MHINTKENRFTNEYGVFPIPEEQVKFNGVPDFLYPNYSDVRENAEKKLVKDKIYTVARCHIYSSWCAIWLKEISLDDKDCFHLQMFTCL